MKSKTKKQIKNPVAVYRPFLLPQVSPQGAPLAEIRERWRLLQAYRHLFLSDDLEEADIVCRGTRDIYIESKHNMHSTRYIILVDSPSEGLCGFPPVYEVHYVFPHVRHLPVWRERMKNQQQDEYWEHLPGGKDQYMQVIADLNHIRNLCAKRAKGLALCRTQYLQRFMPWFTNKMDQLGRDLPRLPEICE